MPFFSEGVQENVILMRQLLKSFNNGCKYSTVQRTDSDAAATQATFFTYAPAQFMYSTAHLEDQKQPPLDGMSEAEHPFPAVLKTHRNLYNLW